MAILSFWGFEPVDRFQHCLHVHLEIQPVMEALVVFLNEAKLNQKLPDPKLSVGLYGRLKLPINGTFPEPPIARR